MSEHTKEPWVVVPCGDTRCGWPQIDSADGEEIVVSHHIMSRRITDANARRIVACVNACVGIPTARLEQFNDGSAAGVASCDTYRRQRDALLTALYEIAGSYPKTNEGETLASIARVAIAAVEGEQK